MGHVGLWNISACFETETWIVVCEKHSVVILHHYSSGFHKEKCVGLTYKHEVDPNE
jgi:hypothetical protein